MRTYYKLPDKDVLMFGDYVGVYWPVKDGVRTRDEPSIDFIWLRHHHETHEVYEDEDSSLAGGLSANEAARVANELSEAAKYIWSYRD